MKLARKVVPVDSLDLHGLEAWLEDMAGRGFHFTGMGSWFAHFEPGAPAEVRYHAEPRGAASPSLAGEQAAYSAQHGWVYVGRTGYFDLYRARDPEAEEFHTDPTVQSYTLDRMSKRLSLAALTGCLGMAAMAALLIWAAIDSPFGPVQRLVESTSLYTMFVSLLLAVLAVHFVRRVLGLRRLRRSLREGVPAPHGMGWRHTALVRQLCFMLINIAALFSICSSIRYFTWGRWGSELAGLDRAIPFLSLEELEDRPGYAPLPMNYPGYEGPDRHNYVSYTRNALSRQFEVSQWGELPGTDTHFVLGMDWYDLDLPFLASPLVDDLFDYHTWMLAYEPERYRVEELAQSGFDRMILVTDLEGRGQQLFACAGDRVLYLDYTGGRDLRDHLDQTAQLLAWDWPGW